MFDPEKELKELKKSKEYFIGIDSDGCVFDTMEIKHKECFCPQYINHFGLQPVSKYAREVWEFVNLYSTTRGVNRFKALIRALELLSERKEVKIRHVNIMRLNGIKDWITRETKLGNPALESEVKKCDNPDLKLSLEWSQDVNNTVEKIVRNVPPFPFVRESLEKLTKKADVIVVSQTPTEALRCEWKEHKVENYVLTIAGQEYGTKTEHLNFATKNKYQPEKILMIGDAPGDYKAAKANNTLFYPIIPGHEEESWEVFFNESLDKFFEGKYKGDYQNKLLENFVKFLPENPPWRNYVG